MMYDLVKLKPKLSQRRASKANKILTRVLPFEGDDRAGFVVFQERSEAEYLQNLNREWELFNICIS